MALVALHGLVDATIGGMLPPQIEQLATAYREQYATYQPADAKYLQMHKMHLLGVRPEKEKFLSEDLIRSVTLTATEDELRERSRARDTITSLCNWFPATKAPSTTGPSVRQSVRQCKG